VELLSDKNNEGYLLAVLRTQLALERNYLAEERTQLAKLRTGLALALLVPTLYIFFISIEINVHIFILVLFYLFLLINAVIGTWMIFNSRAELKKLRNKKKLIKSREKQIFNASKEICELFAGCIEFDEY
jgi:uncharacterized membrane protein YidH (DUF202 family)